MLLLLLSLVKVWNGLSRSCRHNLKGLLCLSCFQWLAQAHPIFCSDYLLLLPSTKWPDWCIIALVAWIASENHICRARTPHCSASVMWLGWYIPMLAALIKIQKGTLMLNCGFFQTTCLFSIRLSLLAKGYAKFFPCWAFVLVCLQGGHTTISIHPEFILNYTSSH